MYLDIDTLTDVTKDTHTHIVSDPGMLASHNTYVKLHVDVSAYIYKPVRPMKTL